MGPCRLRRSAPASLFLVAAMLAGCTSPAPWSPPDHPAATGLPSSPSSTPPQEAPIDTSSLKGRIVFSNGTADIWIIDANGSGPARLTTSPADDFDPALSPDGTKIAFRSMRDGNNEIYVMNADGSHQRNISRDKTDDWGPTWSPDGRRVLWNCARGTITGFHACLANPDGGSVRVLPGDIYVEYAAWSPDGSKIAFMSQEPGAHGSDPDYNIYLMNANGSDARRLTNSPGEDGWPAWSPDGREIAFASTRDDCAHSSAPDCKRSGDTGPYFTLFVMNANGSDQHRITDGFAQFVDWSPEGNYLVFSPGLNVIRPDGTGLASIPTPGVSGGALFPDWGP